ncbi:MAG: uroporphyrinogen-III synthase [Acidobacteriota bacterium]
MSSLQGKTILITRAREQASDFRRLLEQAGARVKEIPVIEIRPRAAPELDQAIARLDDYDWLIFTSTNGADLFFQRSLSLRPQASGLRPRICAIGPATAEKIRQYGRDVELMPALFQAEGVIEELSKLYQGNLRAVRILIPRAGRAREILPEELRTRGAEVDVIPVYDTVVPPKSRQALRQALDHDAPDLITFTSSSTVRHFAELANGRSDLPHFAYAAIGPITAATAREYGLTIVCQPKHSTIPEFARTIERYFQSQT